MRPPRRPARDRSDICAAAPRLVGGGSMPVPSVASPSAPSISAATAQDPSPSWKATSSSVARRNPRPGARNEMASIRLVLPAPFGPNSTIGRLVGLKRRARDNCGSCLASGGGPRAACMACLFVMAGLVPAIHISIGSLRGAESDARAGRRFSGMQGMTRDSPRSRLTPASASARKARRAVPCPGSASASRDRRA